MKAVLSSAADGSRIRKHSVTLSGHRTSVSLEQDFWLALQEIARRDGGSASALIERIDRERKGNLSSALRVYVLKRCKAG